MKVYHDPYLIFYISGKKFKMKEIIMPISKTAIFVFSFFVAMQRAVSVEIFCNCRVKCLGFR